jgi:hypothetical protein
MYKDYIETRQANWDTTFGCKSLEKYEEFGSDINFSHS